jgi:hypothetical protein
VNNYADSLKKGAHNSANPEQKKPRPAGNKFTGTRILRQNPAKYRVIVELIARAIPVCHIARVLRVSKHTLKAIREREAETIVVLRKEYASKVSTLAQDILEKIQAQLARMNAEDAAFAFGVLIDATQALESESTTTMITKSVQRLSFDELIERLPSSEAKAGLDLAPEERSVPNPI